MILGYLIISQPMNSDNIQFYALYYNDVFISPYWTVNFQYAKIFKTITQAKKSINDTEFKKFKMLNESISSINIVPLKLGKSLKQIKSKRSN